MFGPLYASLTAATLGLAVVVLVQGDGSTPGASSPLIAWCLGTVAMMVAAAVLGQYLRVARRVQLTLLAVLVAVSVVGFAAVTQPPHRELQHDVTDVAADA